jgi:hypothetical protein
MNIYRKLIKQGFILFGILASGMVVKKILHQAGKQKIFDSDQLSDDEENLYKATCLELERKTKYLNENK